MKPKTRLENFLAKIAKDPDATIMDPKTRKEVYLDKIAQDNKCKVPEYGEEDIGRVLTVAAGESSQQTVEIVPLQINGVLFGRSPNLVNVNSSVKLTDGMVAHVKFDMWDHHPIVSVEEDVSVAYLNGNYIIEMTVDYDYDISINLTTRTVSGYYNDDHEQQHYPMGVEYSLENFVMTADVEVAETELEWKEVESSGGGVFFVTDNNNTLNKTWAEIFAASTSSVVVLNWNNKIGYLMGVTHVEDYFCTFVVLSSTPQGFDAIGFRTYSISAENGYPVHE